MNTLEILIHFQRTIKEISLTYLVFPGGEVHIRLEDEVLKQLKHRDVYKVSIIPKLVNSNQIMALLQVKEAIDRTVADNVHIVLDIGYIPYARQDRIRNPGEANSSSIFTEILNTLGFDSINTLDPHSDVCIQNINNLGIVNTQIDMLRKIPRIFKRADLPVTLVSPDKGAVAKVQRVAHEFDSPVIYAHKTRNSKTGELTGFAYEGSVTGLNLLIVDDICDGGGTFIGLAKMLLEGGAKSIELYVSHGIFSKGINLLTDNGISHIYTTDTLPQVAHPKLTILKW